jgi:hypothetical protein
MADIDGPLDGYLKQIVDVAGSGLDRLFGHCQGYPGGTPPPVDRLAYLRAHLVKAAAVYVNTIGRTVEQVQQEEQLREALEGFLDRSGSTFTGSPAPAVRQAIRRYVWTEPSLAWARRPASGLSLLDRLREATTMVAVPLVLLPFVPLILAILPFYAVVLRLHELADPAPDLKPTSAHVAQLSAIEDRAPQNQFNALGLLKSGPFRRLTAVVVLFATNYLARLFFNHANLAGVKTIHAARWIFLDNQRRVIFCSNYDGSLESYMDDFIDKVAYGLNATFSCGYGYPKTRWLLFDGAWDEQAFKDCLRCHQVPTDVWYSAYPQLTALNIENNAQIRAGLYGRMTDADAEAWLLRL